jgi:hypothetical protein
MPNPVSTSIDTGNVVVKEEDFEDGLFTFAGADVIAPGTILARNTTNGKWQFYAKGGSTNGNGVPQGVLNYGLTATGAGDLPVRVTTKGVVAKQRLILDADGTGANVDYVVTDLMRSVSLTVIDVQQLAI